MLFFIHKKSWMGQSGTILYRTVYFYVRIMFIIGQFLPDSKTNQFYNLEALKKEINIWNQNITLIIFKNITLIIMTVANIGKKSISFASWRERHTQEWKWMTFYCIISFSWSFFPHNNSVPHLYIYIYMFDRTQPSCDIL